MANMMEIYKLNGHQGPYFANIKGNQLLCSQITAVVSVKVSETAVLSQITALMSVNFNHGSLFLALARFSRRSVVVNALLSRISLKKPKSI
ncbi:hypothetical protein [Bacillus sp. Marseille-Q3570]|uniref:hypothetical protein n=1 Tax=Bacillus sp. Marseille-Q3570 TaxID=2963522 RepID=UPI0021B7A643|nr:hypothetical protein [Bacillus sp. Marseille-Q3570]